MAILKTKDIKKMSPKEMEEKIKDLRLELIKNEVSASKGGKLKKKEIKKTIARLLTLNRINLVKETPKKVSKPQESDKKKILKKSVKK
jgi:ribosomal protein L29